MKVSPFIKTYYIVTKGQIWTELQIMFASWVLVTQTDIVSSGYTKMVACLPQHTGKTSTNFKVNNCNNKNR